jgi:chemotaxis protein methyltransferase CheR
MSAAATALPRTLSDAAGIDLGAYRREHVAERVRRALEREGAATVDELVRRLDADPEARRRFRTSVAVSVSGLFRDPAQFDLLEQTLLPPLLANGRRITVWSAGCANGTELYSLAIVLQRLDALDRAHLLGSDLLEENLAEARRGTFDGVAIAPELRARCRWERRDLTRDGAPPGAWRLALCRNVAIYLARAARRALHQTLAGALAPGGVLLLGRSERLTRPEALGLEPVAPHAYRRRS